MLVAWPTRQRIRLDVLLHSHVPQLLAVSGFLGLLAVAPSDIATLLLAEIDSRLACTPVAAGGPVLGGLVIWINEQLSHRLTGRAAKQQFTRKPAQQPDLPASPVRLKSRPRPGCDRNQPGS